MDMLLKGYLAKHFSRDDNPHSHSLLPQNIQKVSWKSGGKPLEYFPVEKCVVKTIITSFKTHFAGHPLKEHFVSLQAFYRFSFGPLLMLDQSAKIMNVGMITGF